MVLKGIRSAIFGKQRGVIDLNYLHAGRKLEETPLGANNVQFRYRTGVRGGNVDLGTVPRIYIVPASPPHNPEGIDLILPFKKGTPGYRLLVRLPIIRMKLIESRLEELEEEIETRIEAATDMKSFTQVHEAMTSIMDMVQNFAAQMRAGSLETGIAVSSESNKTGE